MVKHCVYDTSNANTIYTGITRLNTHNNIPNSEKQWSENRKQYLIVADFLQK